MRISATYGHGEGVVGNMGIASDTVTLLVSDAHPDELYVLYDNQAKPYRLAPVETPEGIQLGKVPNPPEVKDRPALSPEMLARLYHWGIIGEKFFEDAATDMEIVTKGNTIYPVQARPVNRPMMLPTYLDMHKIATESTSPVTQTLQAEGLVPGKASVVLITDPSQLRVATTLEKAQDQFKKDKHKLVIVEHPEPANSHPVVNFSSLGVPCLVMKDKKSMDAMIAKIDENHPLAVCMQTGTLHHWDNSKGKVDTFTSHGFAVHPAKIALSLSLQKSLPVATANPEVPQEIKDFIITIRNATSQEVALQKLEELKQNPYIENISKGKAVLSSQLSERDIVPKEATAVSDIINSFDAKLTRAFEETKAAISNQKKDERLKPLLQVKVLESLLVGAPKQSGAIGQYSVLDIAPAIGHMHEIIDYQSTLSHPAHFADILLVSHQALTPEGSQKWVAFLHELESLTEKGIISLEQVNQFKSLVQTLQQANVLSQWLTLTFPTASLPSLTQWIASIFVTVEQQDLPAEQKLQALLASFSPSDVAFSQQQLHSLQAIHSLRDRLDRFASPDTYQKAWQELKQHVRPEAQAALAKQMQAASPTARLIALNTMKELIDTYDLAIKTMKASPQWEAESTVPQFKAMLIPFLGLLTNWHNNGIVPSGAIPDKGSQSIPQYLDKLKEILLDMPSNDTIQLQPSADFSVAGAMLGCLTPLKYHTPKHLEDMFTLIHQNLLGVISAVSNHEISPQIVDRADLPSPLKKAMDYISAKHLSRIALEVTETGVEVKYNVPLNYHSGQLTLIYDKNDQTTKLKEQLLGGNWDFRWDFLGDAARVMSDLGLLKLASPIQPQSQELAIDWLITDDNSLQDALDSYATMAEYTIEYANRRIDRALLSICKRREIDVSDAIFSSSGESARILASMALLDGKMDKILPKVSDALQGDVQMRSEALDILIGLTDYWYICAYDGDEDAPPLPAQITSTAIDAINTGLSSDDLDIKRLSHNLLFHLVSRGGASDLAEKVASQGLTHPDSDIRWWAFDILGALVRKGEALNLAKSAVAIGLADPDSDVQSAAENLQTILEKTG